ncbi:sulfotransferase family 2 domain-containing protein [Mangrovimonas cancribranchiae]|uniref:Sulfotransferase family 2 domain-containing protein n=1 Tax=Mangrovimonas cancribranchiae TaxID=3080055 RepID=A0AAU6P1K5_9FLAO
MRVIDRLKRKEKVDKVVIHIGKCGGSSVIEELKKRDVKFFEKHVGEVTYRKKKKYIIVIRNPISRFVSAFNWRYKLVVEDGTQKDLYQGEKELLEKYSDINSLAEAIYDEKGALALDFKKDKFYIHHLKEDIDFYLGDFLKKCKKEQIIAILATETLSEDLKTHFNITLKSHLKKNKKKTNLSNLAVNNLIQYLEKDYDCIEKLNSMDVLTEKQYEKLSNKVF